MAEPIRALETDALAPEKPPRLTLIDVARGLALIAMATYHLSWDFEYFGYLDPGTTGRGLFRLYARLIAGSFLFVAGFSLVLASLPSIHPRAFALRFAKIAAAAAVITLATWIAMPDGMIFFGILHAIATFSLIGLAFLRLPVTVAALAAIAAILLPLVFRAPLFDMPVLWWVGLSETPPRSNDYVPLLPWIAPFLAGLVAARLSLARGFVAALARFNEPRRPWKDRLATLGRWSLPFYLLHQPVLFAAVYAISLVHPAPVPDPSATYLQTCVSACSANPDGVSCARFCACTLDALKQQSLFDDLNAGRIDVGSDDRIGAISRQCTMNATEE
ncbi:DUF1624 domain-containing protein [Ensifer soli]|uniref:DUF1624 domain-containing protein n=1 Tax=Ciceribacter sp. sgz301302 TaxID=3342379 RepID=UPI0035B6FB8D